MPYKSHLTTTVIYLIITILVVFLFIGGEAQQQHRLIKDTWDAGHLVLFGLISFAFFHSKKQAHHSLLKQVFVTTFFCLLLGTAIEFAQLLFNREFSRDDIINDMIGGYLGLCMLFIAKHTEKNINRVIAGLFFIILSIIGLRNFEQHLLDEYRMRTDFPVLADFENKLEESRWENKLVNTQYSTRYSTSGNNALQVEYLRGRYPNISLEHFMRNWSGYQQLSFSVYNPEPAILNFTLKIDDYQHVKNGRRFTDRLNKKIQLQQGWNHINIPVEEIRQAPRQRSMDISQINTVSLFTDKLEKPVTIYLDNMRLEK